jgi:helicase MOV-10
LIHTIHRPGTGKTVTLVEAIRQILEQDKSKKITILACAPSNSAADLIAERLSDFLATYELFRFYAPSRHSGQVPDALQEYTYKPDGVFSIPEGIRRYRVVVSTCVSSSVFYGIGMEAGEFDYIFIDEAAQATEPEVMIAIQTMADNRTRVVLAGDHLQLGPVIRSDVARDQGLEMSYQERLMQLESYKDSQKRGIRSASTFFL